jgi:hypothetical protein
MASSVVIASGLLPLSSTSAPELTMNGFFLNYPLPIDDTQLKKSKDQTDKKAKQMIEKLGLTSTPQKALDTNRLLSEYVFRF